MGEIDRIVGVLDAAFAGPSWHGPSLLEALDGVSAAAALARPVRGAHSIWELTNHAAAWKRIVAQRLRGRVVQQVPEAVNFPPPSGRGAPAWRSDRERLRRAHAALRAVVARIAARDLDRPPPAERSSRHVQAHGIAHHDIYHAGQIVLLRRALGNY